MDVAILGGGPAGLAAGYYAQKYSLPFTVFEAADYFGGNCRTIVRGQFRFDTGAHRFHDKDPEVTQEVMSLLGDELVRVSAMSQVYLGGVYFDFPLSPWNLLRGLSVPVAIRAIADLIRARLSADDKADTFENHAVRTYGRSIAEMFLLGYSEKLWGTPCRCLSPRVSGARLKGLNMTALLKTTFAGRVAKAKHLDGSFYYPRWGYGTIVEKLAAACGASNVQLNAKITGLTYRGDRVHAIEVNGRHNVAVDRVISTLPLPLLISLMRPAAPSEVVKSVADLRYRDVRLVALFLGKPSVTRNASVYFPDRHFPFTRISEPRNRSALMAPRGHTSLLVEVPCSRTDEVSGMSHTELTDKVVAKLTQIRWLSQSDIVDACVTDIKYAYPILEVNGEQRVQVAMSWLGQFRNLSLAGRNGLFGYSHLHDMIRNGRDVIGSLIDAGVGRSLLYT